MPARKAEAQWSGGLKDGSGTVTLGSGAFNGKYSFSTRFEEGQGTNPEELIGAAHAGCYSMALSAGLEKAGHKPNSVQTTAKVHLSMEGGPNISKIELDTVGDVPGLDQAGFQKFAEEAKVGCPVSKALAATQITLTAKLK